LRELSLHLLDIAENSIAADAKKVTIVVSRDSRKDRLYLSVDDDGRGMDAETAARVIDPFVTSRTTRKVGLGIPLLKAAAEACDGYLQISSTPDTGTLLEVEFQDSHIDRMPLGDLSSTLLQLVIGNPEIHFVLIFRDDNYEFIFDDEPIKNELQGIPLSEPGVIEYIRSELEEGIRISATQPA